MASSPDPPEPPDQFDRTEPGGRPSLVDQTQQQQRARPEQRSRPSAGETQQTPPPPNVSPSRASVPPSEPRSTSRGSFSQIDLVGERPARLQMIVALVLVL